MKSLTNFILFIAACSVLWFGYKHPEYFEMRSHSTPVDGQKIKQVEARPPDATIATTPEPVIPHVEQPGVTRQYVPPDPLPKKDHWTWSTSDGKMYGDVRIVKVEADCVTILDSDGGARIEIEKLPADIQSQLNYDPSLGGAAARKRAREMAIDHRNLAVATTKVPDPVPPPPPAVAIATPQSDTAKNDLKDRIAALQAEYDRNMAEAAAADARFESPSNRYMSANGEVEHTFTNGAQGFRDAAASDMSQINALKSQLQN